MKFSEIVGQKKIKQYFLECLDTGSFSHAYLLEGAKGSGKASVVDALAHSLFCENSEGLEACGKCRSCHQLDSGNHPDLIWLKPGKKTGYGVDDVREGIIQNLEIPPYQSQYKIYVIRNAETLTVEAQNALLKTIEEPAEYVLLFLLSQNKEMLLETVCSRCTWLKLEALSEEEMLAYLKAEGWESYQALLPFCHHNLGELISKIQSEKWIKMKENAENLLNRFLKTKEYDIMESVAVLEQMEEDLEEMLEILQIVVQNRLNRIMAGSQKKIATLEEKKLFRFAERIVAAKKQKRSNVNPSLIAWNLFLP